jgi:hypothetical protein
VCAEQMDKRRLIGSIHQGYQSWQRLLSELPEGSLERSGGAKDWNIKDLIAHITWYEREMVELLRDRRLEGSEWWRHSNEKRNQLIYAANRDLQLVEVLGEAEQVHKELVGELERLEDEDLHDPKRFAGMPQDWIPWKIIADNTYQHYQAHIPFLAEWMQEDR